MSEETNQMAARFPVELVDAVDEAAHESRTSRSEVLRNAVRFALVECDDFEIPDWIEERVEAQRVKQKGINKRTKVGLLENRIPQQMDDFFQAQPKSWKPENVEDVMESYVEEAEVRFGEDAPEVEEVREKIQSELEDYREAYTASNWNPDSENRYMRMAGPEDGSAEVEIAEQGEEIAAVIRQRLPRDDYHQMDNPAKFGKGKSYDPSPSQRVEAILDSLANDRGVDREVLEEMLMEAFEAESMPQLARRFTDGDGDAPAIQGGEPADD